jgi:hypothetical protein
MPSSVFLPHVLSSAILTTDVTALSDMIMCTELKVIERTTCDLFYDSVPEFHLRHSGKPKNNPSEKIFLWFCGSNPGIPEYNGECKLLHGI